MSIYNKLDVMKRYCRDTDIISKKLYCVKFNATLLSDKFFKIKILKRNVIRA
jgi:hypothetical protein